MHVPSARDVESDRFWQRLLAARATHKWGNFSWFSLGTLIQSANDTLAKADRGRIIDTRRMRWVAAQRARGIDADVAVRLSKAKRVLLLGDPGEMDASQYVLVRDLVATEAHALILMSDVVYPAGDINAWRDAVYLPYLGLPETVWAAACAAREKVAPPTWHVFATPGNHDWYDGLTGFMFHACGAEPLPDVQFSSSGLTSTQRLVRSGWQHPVRPDRAMLDPLRAETAARWTKRQAPGPMPFQPGPYYAIDIGQVGAAANAPAAVRLVTVDTGIDGSIDTEQARWIQRTLAASKCPNIVITGKPIVVNNRINGIPINRSSRTGASEEHVDQPPDLRDLLVAPGANVVATVAGDIHNAQRLLLAGHVRRDAQRHPVLTINAAAREEARRRRLPPAQLIAGGGGAYLSATHTITLLANGRLRLSESGEAKLDLHKRSHYQFPSREQSAQRFAARVGVLAGITLMVLGVLLVLAVALVLERGAAAVGKNVALGAKGVDLWQVVAGSYALLAVGGLLALAVMAWRRQALTRALSLSAGTLAALVASVYLLWDVPLERAQVFAAGIATALLIPILPVALPLLRAFPALRRLLPLRVLAFAVLGAAGALLTERTINEFFDHHLTAILLIGVVLLGALGAATRFLVAILIRKRDEWAIAGTHSGWRWFIGVASLWPVALIVPPLLLLGDSDKAHGVQRLAILILLLELGALVVALMVVAVSLLARSWHHRPPGLTRAVLVAMAAGAVAGALAAKALLDFGDIFKLTAIAAVCAVGAGLVTVGAVLLTSRSAVPTATLTAALRNRECIGDAPRGRDVLRTMAVASIPGISELAEATSPPFHKSFMIVEPRCDAMRTTAIVFEVYAVDDERKPGVSATVALDEPPAAGIPRGSYLVDRLTIELTEPLEPQV